MLEVYSELNSFPFLQEDYRQKLEQKRLARELESKLKALEAEKAEAVAAKIAAEEAAKKKEEDEDKKAMEKLEEEAAKNREILAHTQKEANIRVDLYKLKLAHQKLAREKAELERKRQEEREQLEADKARLEAQLKEKEQLEADKARLEAQLQEKERELKESESRRVAEASADTIGIEDDVDSDVGLASTDELMAGAASLPPPTNPTSAEGSSTRPTTPEPPSTTTSESDPTVGEKLAELAVMVATSEATMAAVDKTASTGSTSALDSSISELGMDAFPDIPEEGEEDYDFRFSQLSDFSQKM